MSNDLQQRVSQLLGTAISTVDKLHGDASYRTYYRAKAADGATFIVMQMPEGKQSVSEEITNFNGAHEELPFINVQKFLAGCDLPVPRIIKEDYEHHLLVLEDLGDDLMARHVGNADTKTQTSWYRKAIDLLVAMQEKTDAHRDDVCVAFKRSFDERLFTWEFDHFYEYGIEAQGIAMSDTDRAVFNEETRAIARKIATLPYGFTHRDFQSRNLLVRNDELVMIDFQDALIGPRVYDLVALLRDSYVRLDGKLVTELVNYYAQTRKMKADWVHTQFALVTIQRKLKDAGRFVFIDRVKHNPGFLQYIPTTLGYVRDAFEHAPEYGRLHDVLAKYVPELQ